MVQAEVYAPMEPPEPEFLAEAQKPDEALDQVGQSPTPDGTVDQEPEVPEPLQIPMVTPQPMLTVLEQLTHT